MKIALLQTPVTARKEHNLETARRFVRRAAAEGARMAVLPEMFCCPYTNDCFRDYAEPAGGPVWQAMSRLARECGICLVAGSMPELEEGKIYNTAFVFSPDGKQLARHRKMHLFDVDFEGGQYFKESDTFSPGNEVTVFPFDGLLFGLCICFDMRFPELSRLMTLKGAQVILAPAAFNMTTGPLHWELMFRQRAVDNQLFTAGAAPARDEHGPYVSYGNSILCDPMGRVPTRADAEETILYGEIDPGAVESTRRQLPLLQGRRSDVYTLK